jgi:Ser/Thr protein kinase RdoA (MazF antagonist)
VPLPVHTRSGESLLVRDGRAIELEAWLPNSSPLETWSRYRTAFALLGSLHAALEQYPGTPAVPAPRVQNYGVPATLGAWVRAAMDRIRETGGRQAGSALEVCAEALDLLRRLDVWWEGARDSLPQHLVHGDYGVGNLLWRGEAAVAVVDFDFLAVHERVFDLAYAAFWMLERLEPEVPPEQRTWQRVPILLAAYDSAATRPLLPLERAAILPEIARVPLYWVGEAAFVDDPTGAVLRSASGVAAARWIVERLSLD